MKSHKFITEVGPSPSDWKLDHQSKILTLGSCFAEVLGSQMNEYKFPVVNSPFGTIFNPISIIKVLNHSIDKTPPNSALYLQSQDGVWLHHDFHSSQWSEKKDVLEEQLLAKFEAVCGFLKTAKLLVITLGTAYIYRHKATGALVGNCHKQPADRFIKELLHPDQIVPAFDQLLEKLRTYNRDLQILLTVSPVRHTKDTLPLNQVSKSVLRLVCHRLSEKFKHVTYFPSYEIMLDELRDYRFYEEDLIHPNKIAEDYIFDRFSMDFIQPEALDLMKQWDNIRQTLSHRPLHGATKSHLKLLTATRDKLLKFNEVINVSRELEEIDKRLGEFSTQT